MCSSFFRFFFFFNDTATTEIYTLSLHDALPILTPEGWVAEGTVWNVFWWNGDWLRTPALDVGILPGIGRARVLELVTGRSEEHTSELQSQSNLVCRLLLEKKKKKT